MDLRRTPFHARHLAAGARMVPFAGFDMPVQYEGVGPEHLQVRRSVGLFDVSHMGEIRVVGPDAEAALNRLLSNDVSAVQIGQAQYSAMCNERGGIVDDVFVYRLGTEEFLVCVNASNRDKDFAWMTAHNEYNEHAGAVFTDEGDLWAQVAIQGRDAEAVCRPLTPVDLAALGRHRFAVGNFAGVPGCVIARTGYTGEDGFEVFIPAKDADPVWPAILESGAPFGIAPVGLGARDTLRLEVRNALYGHELTDETSPIQAGLGWITKTGKAGGFIGSEAILARKATDTEKLAGFVVDGGRIPREGLPVLLDGAPVGRVTSGTRSPSLGQGVGIAYVRNDLAKAGQRLVVDVRGRPADATVVAGPFYKRDY